MAESVSLPGFQRQETYALVFTGYLHVARAGLYTLALSSDDGSVLEVDGRVVVDNDGWHSEQEKSGMVALEAGYHPLVIRFVQGSGAAVLSGTIAFDGEAPAPLAGSFLAH